MEKNKLNIQKVHTYLTEINVERSMQIEIRIWKKN